MKRSTDRILTTHVGSLPRPDDLREMLIAKDEGQSYDKVRLAYRVREAVDDVVQRQVAHGIDIVNDGEESKRSWSTYARERLAGHGPSTRALSGAQHTIYGRDNAEFPEYFEVLGPGRGPNTRGGISSATRPPSACVAPIQYIGQTELEADIENLKSAIADKPVAEAFMSAVSPGTIEHWLRNEYYPDVEAYLMAVADAMSVEYEAIVNAGFVLQIDDPDLADAWQMYPEMDVDAYKKYAMLRIEALNHALRNVPPDMVRLHVCWGSYHGPHKYDIGLAEIIDVVFAARCDAYSIEAANPRHEHEWRIWEDIKLPANKLLVPGFVGHASDFVEHPRLVADRIIQYAKLVGRENVIASTDCGLGPRVGHPSIAWAKFDSLAEGARIASKELWS